MGLDAVLTGLEGRARVTPVTPRYPERVTTEPLPIKACTPVTPVTPITDNTGNHTDATIEPRRDPQPIATREQATELRALIAVVLANDTNADRGEALTIAMADPDAALTSFRALAADLQDQRMMSPIY